MRILFVTANRIGDAVLSTGVLSHLVERHPDARFTVAVGPAPAPLFADMPRLEQILVVRKAAAGLHWLALWRAVAGKRWDMVVDLRRSLLCWTVRARRRRRAPAPDEFLHKVRLLGRMVGREEDPPAPRLWLQPAHRAAARRLVPDGLPVLGVGPAANWPGKQWPPERFAALVERATAVGGVLPGARLAVFAAGHERASIAPMLARVPAARTIDLVGAVDLPTAAACLERCAAFVGNDSGLMHIAAAVGTPTLGLFGPSREQHYAPWGERAAWVRTERTYEELVGAPGYDHRTTGSIMDSLSVDRASEAFVRLWTRAATAPVPRPLASGTA